MNEDKKLTGIIDSNVRKNHQQFDLIRITNASNQRTKTSNIPTTLDNHCWLRYQAIIAVGTYIAFMLIIQIITILIISIILSRSTNKSCKLIFQRTLHRPIVDSSSNSHPRHIAVGYFNNDDHFDLAVANSDSGNVGIFLGYGNGSFTNQLIYSIGFESHPYCIAVGDFNNDKQIDIVVADYGINSIVTLFGNGNGIFSNLKITSLGSSRPRSLTVADFNNDNHTDIIVVNDGTFNVIILLNLGNGFFQIESIYYMGYDSSPYAVAVGHFNNDNQLDFAVVNYGTSNLVIFLSNENQTFVKYQYSTGSQSQPSSIIVDDINNDHILDVIITNSGNSNVGIFYGSGNGTFRNLVTYSTGSYSCPWFIALGDLDDDNIEDMIIADATNHNVIIFKGYENESYSIITEQNTGITSNPFSLVVADFDHDNKSDIAITNYENNNIFVLTSYIIKPTANPTFYSIGTNSLLVSFALADFNYDKHLDIIVSDLKSKKLIRFVGFGNGSFSQAETIVTIEDYGPTFIAIGDFNNDNKSDIAMAIDTLNNIHILLGQSDGSFIFGDWYFTSNGGYLSSITVADINNDNNLDIITTNCWMDIFHILIGYGNGTFDNGTTYYTGNGSCPTSVAVANLNNDHLTDIVVSTSGYTKINVNLGYKNGSFLQKIMISTGDSRPFRIVVIDLNNDNQFDIVFFSLASANIGICLGYGNGTFGHVTTYSTGEKSSPRSMIIDDFNQDTRLDIFVANYVTANIIVFLGRGDGTFARFREFTNANLNYQRSIASGDFNNDHNPDIVTMNSIESTIIVLVTEFIGMFEGQTNYLTGSSAHPYAIATGYLNNDSRLDIAIANSGNDNVQIFFNYDSQNFLNGPTESTGFNSHPQSVAIADFNHDHRLDIVTANFKDNSITVFCGFDNGTLDKPSKYLTGSKSFPASIAIGDFNNDSWIDIIVANQGADNVGIFLGFNYATFTRHNDIPTNVYLMSHYVVAADFNNDFQMDIAVIHMIENIISIYLKNENGSFIERTTLKTNLMPYGICVGDFNDDNHIDMAVISWSSSLIEIFLGYGDGTFVKQAFNALANQSILVSITTDDFNNDDILDLVIADQVLNYIGIMMGYGNGSFGELMIYYMPNGSHPIWVVTSDFNNDHIRDIAIANRGRNHIGILFGYGNGTFKDIEIYSTGNNSSPCSIAVGDFNRDNWMDFAVANQNSQSIGIFLNYGNGTFLSQATYSTGLQSKLWSIAVGDLNNDSMLDIAFTDSDNSNGNIGMLYGSSDGKFIITAKRYSTGYESQPSSIIITDLNNDNRIDIIVGDYNMDNIYIMLNDRIEPFGTQIVLSTGNHSQPISVAVSDFNNDQQLDIAVVNYGTNNIGIFLGYNNGSFAEQQIYSTGNTSHPNFIAIADFNNDKQFDIIVADNTTDDICILFGYDNGIFTIGSRYSTGMGSAPSFIAIADLNNDNYLDIIIANRGLNNIFVFFGLSNAKFTSPDSYALGYNAHPQSIAIGDFNNDNLLDIIIVNYDTNCIDILLQKCSFI